MTIKPHNYLVLIKVQLTDLTAFRFHLEVVASDDNRAKAEALRITREQYPQTLVYAIDCHQYPQTLVYAIDCHRIYDDRPVGWLVWFTNLFKR